MQNIAAIDVGSNAMRMVVGRVNSTGRVEVIDNIRLPVRLGGDAFSRGQIGEQIMQATLDAFLRFRKVANDFGVTRVRAIATSALREAANRDLLIDRISRHTNIQLETISGEEEARLIHLAISKAINLKGKRAVLIDIGGGSVEVTTSEGEKIISSESYNMGTVRLLRKFSTVDPKILPFSKLVRAYTEAARRRIDREIGRNRVDLCIGTGGNVEEMGQLRRKLFKRDQDDVISVKELNDLIEILNKMSLEDRISKLNLRPDRADVILPASVVLHTIARLSRVKEIQIPGVGLKDGLLWDMASQVPGLGKRRRDQVWASAMRLGEKYELDTDHGALVANLARRLFDQSLSLHGLAEGDRILLEVAALLHDIGHFINTIDHDKHGYYILMHNFIIGLDERQQEIVANVIRYHRKVIPSLDHENFKSLPQKDRLIVTKLSALLRLADGIDTSHTGRVRAVNLEKKKGVWTLKLHGRGDRVLEKWSLNKRRFLFQEVFGETLEIE
jgi:exopolyphosphatase / guanosine-5'-triphosphate,3'-diphosphate pyrophosphatase